MIFVMSFYENLIFIVKEISYEYYYKVLEKFYEIIFLKYKIHNIQYSTN